MNKKTYIFDSVIEKIDRGRLGLNEGLPYGFNKLIEYVPNIQMGTYYAIGAEPSVGKTSLTDDMFMYNPYDWINLNKNDTNITLKIFYFSFEIEKSIKITKGVCRKLWKDHKLLVDINYVLSRGKNRISDGIYDKVLETRRYFEEFEDNVTIIDIGNNPTGIFKYLENYFEKNGKSIITDDSFTYISNKPNEYPIIIIDHAALVKSEKGFNTKEKIDKLSEYLMILRNRYNAIPVIVSQFHRGLANAERQLSLKKDPEYDRIEPTLADFKDTGNIPQDANIIMSLFSPSRYDIPSYKNYNCSKVGDRLRFLKVLKTRDGSPNISLALGYLGEVGLFNELPVYNDPKIEEVYEELISFKKLK